MHEPFYENKNIVVADFDYQAALFLFKNKHPDLDIKIISRHELINKVSYSFSKDPIPFLIKEGIGYKKAKKYLNIILTADVSKNKELTELFNKLNDNGYLIKDEYGLYELQGSHIFLFEMEQDIAIQKFLERNGLAYSFLRLEGLDLYKNNAYISPNIIYFENKMTQFFYIFSWVRDKARDNPNQKQRIIINGDEDIFYVKIMSELFHIPVCYVEERPLISIKSVRAKINKIYSNKTFDFTDEVIEDQDIQVLKEIIEYYGLNKGDNFLFSYANLLEIVASKNTRIPVGEGGVVISNKFVFDPSFFTYVTNFNSDAFYKIYADDNVLSDAELKEVSYNTSYTKTAIERRNKINFLRHNNVAVISRVERHLGDKIFDSPLLKEIWKDKKIKYEDDLEMPTFTTQAAFLYSSTILNKSGILFDSNFFNAYNPSFKGLHSGEDFRKSTWSVTGLESFINCPFKYYLTKLIPLDKNDYSKRFIGTAIHKVFEKFNHVDYVFEDALKEGEEAYYKEFDKVGITPTNRDKALLEISQIWLKRFMKTYQKVQGATNFVKPIEDDYEKSIQFYLEDENNETYNFYGKIDKIVISESNGHKYYSIIDYKTGMEDFNPLEVFLGKSIQLPLYYYAIENNIQPSQYTQDGDFGGFYIQHVFFSTIKSALKDVNKPTLSEKRLAQQSRLAGINKDSASYIASIDRSAFKEDGSLKNNGGDLLQLKHQFKESDSDEIIIKDDGIGLPRYNLSDLVDDVKKAAINAIHRICEADFIIQPTSYSLLEFDATKTVCNNCPYRRVCYRSKSDVKDYKKDVLKHFKKGAK